MRKAAIPTITGVLFLATGLLFPNLPLSGQAALKESTVLPENISAIVTVSCMPCHSDKGGLMARGKLNFSEWTNYSTNKQKEKANKIYYELKKGAMPPKSVRETRPEIIPSKEQIDSIKKWADSLKADDK
jgi:hypothetical protein